MRFVWTLALAFNGWSLWILWNVYRRFQSTASPDLAIELIFSIAAAVALAVVPTAIALSIQGLAGFRPKKTEEKIDYARDQSDGQQQPEPEPEPPQRTFASRSRRKVS